MTNKIQLFQGTSIRTVWDNQTEEWYFSVADICNVLSGSQAKIQMPIGASLSNVLKQREVRS